LLGGVAITLVIVAVAILVWRQRQTGALDLAAPPHVGEALQQRFALEAARIRRSWSPSPATVPAKGLMAARAAQPPVPATVPPPEVHRIPAAPPSPRSAAITPIRPVGAIVLPASSRPQDARARR
jgi:hypothetical protein